MKAVLIFLSVAMSAPIYAIANIDRTRPPEPGPSPKVTFPDYQERELSNGLKIFFVQSDKAPTITFRMVIKAGSARDGEKSGLSGILATLLGRGTRTRDAGQFAEEIDFLGAQFKGGSSDDAVNATARGLSIYTDEILDLFADAILNPAFLPGELALEKKKVRSRLEAERQQPDSLAKRLRDRLMFGDFPYANSATPESVESIVREDLENYRETWFAPNNATLAVVGDFEIERLLPKLEKAFGNWEPAKVEPMPKPQLTQHKGLTIHLVDRPGSVQSTILVTRLSPARDDANVPELQLLNITLGGGMTSRLFANLREKHGYTYGAYSSFSFRKEAGVFSAGAEVRNEVTTPAIKEMLKELSRISTDAIPADELDIQRQFMVGNFLLSLEDPDITASRVQDIEFYGLPEDYYDTLVQRLMAVTPEKELDLAGEYLGATDYTIVVVGDAAQIGKSLEKLGEVVVYDTDLNRKEPSEKQ